jgi:filamentous hemagglutinin family protein
MFRLFATNFVLLVLFSVFYPLKSSAQVVPDDTLGTESSTINSIDELRDAIEGGAIRGDNLFHSFQEFNVSEGASVNFTNPAGIANIFSRVTGGNVSEIFGTLGVDGAANLFLMNPNGIIFGENSAINVNGSFLATTADEINFDNGDRFSAVDPNIPTLTINLPIGLGFGSNPGDIEINGVQNNVLVEIPSFRIVKENYSSGLKVNSGSNISLIGGNINFNGGGLQAPGGDIELISLKADQQIDFTALDSWFTINNDSEIQYSDISLSNAAYLDVSDEVAGNITLRGQNIYVNDGSVVLANTSLPTDNAIEISASNLLELKGSSGQEDKNLTSLKEINDIVKEARNGINKIEGRGNYYSVSLIAADVFSGENGTGNQINISANKINVIDGAEIRTVNFSPSTTQIAGGDIQIDSQDLKVEGTNRSDNFLPSFITSTNGISKFGNTGNLNISSKTIRILEGAAIKVDTFGFGKGGNLKIDADSILIKGFQKTRFNPQSPLINKSSLVASSSNEGLDAEKSGSIDINTNTLEILAGGGIGSNSFGRNSAGEINIKAKNINLIGFDENINSQSTSISASVTRDSNQTIPSTINEESSKAGNIRLETDQLKILNGASIEANSNSGNSGSIIINAKDIELNGSRQTEVNFTGGLSTSTAPEANGVGGNIEINTDSLKILDGSIIRAISLGSGDAGNININAKEIEISGVDRFATDPVASERVSKINTGSLNTNGGDLTIASDSIKLDNFGKIQATSIEGNQGGNINLDTDSLKLFGQSNVTASAGGQGNGGNITIDSETLLGLENSDITANAIAGNGGNIEISSDFIFGLESRPELTPFSDITASSELGIDGTVKIFSPENNAGREVVIVGKKDRSVNYADLVAKKCTAYGEKAAVVQDLGSSYHPDPLDAPYDEDLPDVSGDRQTIPSLSQAPQDQPIVQANTIKITPDGRTLLVNEAKSNHPVSQPQLCTRQ